MVIKKLEISKNLSGMALFPLFDKYIMLQNDEIPSFP